MIEVAVLTISDSCSSGLREDLSGPKLRERVEQLGWRTRVHEILPDEPAPISQRLRELSASGVSLILTTGGTGAALRDVTPEAVRDTVDKEIPGLGELMRAEGLKSTPLASLSRSLGGTLGRTLILCLPGSPRGALESFNAVAHLIPHIVELLRGNTGHHATDAKLKV